MADKIDAQTSRYALPHIRIERFRKVSDYRPPGLKIEPNRQLTSASRTVPSSRASWRRR